MKRLTLALLACALPAAASADSLRDGLYRILTDGAQGTLEIRGDRASLGIAAPGCSGAVSGMLSSLRDGVATVTDRSYGDVCTITITADADGFPARLDESGCMAYSGAMCSFSGEVTGPDVAWTTEAVDAGFTGLSRELRLDVQRALQARGHYRGGIDGAIGPGTRGAIVGAAREDLGAGRAIDLSDEEAARGYMLALLAADQTVPGTQVATAEAPASPETPTAPSRENVADWRGDWSCQADFLDEEARFTFEEERATFHNLGITTRYSDIREIGGRTDALEISMMDGERLGLFNILPGSMIIAASVGIFDCRR